jgi:hypothetical protein
MTGSLPQFGVGIGSKATIITPYSRSIKKAKLQEIYKKIRKNPYFYLLEHANLLNFYPPLPLADVHQIIQEEKERRA